MRIATKQGLNLLIITMIISIFGALSAIGVLADESTFWVNTVEDIPIQYKVTTDGVFKEVEVVKARCTYNGGYGSSSVTISPTNNITIPDTVVYNNEEYTVTSIGECAFSAQSYPVYHGGSGVPGAIVSSEVNFDLKHITIPDSVKCIKRDAFSHCTALSDIDLPDNLEVIEDGAFFGTALTAVEIPKEVTDIGDFAFAECCNLKTVISSSNKPANVDITTFANRRCSDLKIYIPLGLEDAYAKAGWPEDYLIPVYNFSL